MIADSSCDVPAIARIALANDQPQIFHPVEQPRHIRHPGDESLGDLSAAEALMPCSAKYPEHVVLGSRYAVRP